MAIKTITSIPESKNSVSQRDLIRRDIKEAISNGISRFEFIDDAYKYDTLITNARQTLRIWFHKEIYYQASRCAHDRLQEKIKKPFWTPMAHEYDNKVFSLSKRKLKDRTHVYCTLNLDVLKNLEQIIYDDTLKRYTEKRPKDLAGESNERDDQMLPELQEPRGLS